MSDDYRKTGLYRLLDSDGRTVLESADKKLVFEEAKLNGGTVYQHHSMTTHMWIKEPKAGKVWLKKQEMVVRVENLENLEERVRKHVFKKVSAPGHFLWAYTMPYQIGSPDPNTRLYKIEYYVHDKLPWSVLTVFPNEMDGMLFNDPSVFQEA